MGEGDGAGRMVERGREGYSPELGGEPGLVRETSLVGGSEGLVRALREEEKVGGRLV